MGILIQINLLLDYSPKRKNIDTPKKPRKQTDAKKTARVEKTDTDRTQSIAYRSDVTQKI